MAIVNYYLSVTSTATPISPDSSASQPTLSNLMTSCGNKEFMDRMKKLIQDPDTSTQVAPVKEVPSGFLSLNRVMSLDSLEVDLSKQLAASPAQPELEQHVEAATQSSKSTAIKWRPAPTRREQEKWDRATKAATGGSEVMFRELRRSREDPKLKKRLQVLTLGIGGVGLVSAYVSIPLKLQPSYGVGFLGSLAYMRMLGSSVDSMADGARGLLKGAIGQPRLLVPVVLVMILTGGMGKYLHWYFPLGDRVPQYGFMHLELIPMLVGFFTYKIATFVQAIEEAIPTVEKIDTSS
ncbi:hypothetical protein M0R45_031204 [Rubus argutus]|uniref:CGL160/ATPI domain-containing protein n=1 Tax=Rubus argutus TaxID=59490 RepID=A0AAW1WHF0_RUBAR